MNSGKFCRKNALEIWCQEANALDLEHQTLYSVSHRKHSTGPCGGNESGEFGVIVQHPTRRGEDTWVLDLSGKGLLLEEKLS